MEQQFVVSARKYRPQQFSAVVDQGTIVATLKNAILRQQLAHAYLFCGPRGVGKTTCARIFAKTINCLNPTPTMEACGECESCRSFDEGRSYCIHELDAASNNSVDDIRELIDKVRIPPQIGKYSVYIIDEVHMLSQAAFNAFLKTLEEPPAYALFILATTEKHKVLPTILSRCQSFDFNRISIKAMVTHLQGVAAKEGVSISVEALHVIAQKADGALRDALTLLDQCIAVCGKEITYQQVITNLNVLDREYYFQLVDMALKGQFDQMLLLFDQVLSKGFNALHFIGGLSSHFRDLLVCKQPSSLPLLEYGEETAKRFTEQAALCKLPFLFKALSLCAQAEAGYKTSNNPRLHIELALIRLSQLIDTGISPQQVIAPQSAAAPKVLEAPQSTVAPKSTVAAQPVASPQPATGSLSINALLSQSIQKEKEEAQAKEATPNTTKLTQETLEASIPKLLALFPTRPAFINLLSRKKPLLIDHNIIQFYAVNPSQIVWVKERFEGTITQFFRNEFHHPDLLFRMVIDEETAQEKKEEKPYMPEEKAKFIMEHHPEIAQLKNDLNLTIS